MPLPELRRRGAEEEQRDGGLVFPSQLKSPLVLFGCLITRRSAQRAQVERPPPPPPTTNPVKRGVSF